MARLKFMKTLLYVLVGFGLCGIMFHVIGSQWSSLRTGEIGLKRGVLVMMRSAIFWTHQSTQTVQQRQQSYDLGEHTDIYRDHFHDNITLNSQTNIFIFSAFVKEQQFNDQYPSFSITGYTVSGNRNAEKLSKARENIYKPNTGDGEDNATVRQEVLTVFDVQINGWEHQDYKQQGVKCCYLWETGEVSEFLSPSRNYYLRTPFLSSVHYRCLHFNRSMKLQGVHIQTHNNSCETVKHRFVKPLSPHRPEYNGMIAVCLKVIFGETDPKWLIEWFEHYKELKVDRVFLTTYNVSESVHKVIQHYVAEGFVEAVVFDFPWKRRLKRTVGQKAYQVWDDEQVVVFDFAVRYKEYSFTSIIDLDEFLVPAEGDLKTLMYRLVKNKPRVGVFKFKSNLMIKSWGKTPMYGTSVVSQFIHGTPSVVTRQKYVAINNRIVEGRRSTHFCTPKKGYKAEVVPSELAVLYHYRTSCYSDLKTICNGNRVNHTNILRIIEKTDPRSLSVAKKLELA